MAWVRYDDGFDSHPKVSAVIVEDPAALSLHLLANTWSNKQKKWPGFVPRHQPAALVCDRKLGQEWAAVLVRHGLWHDRASMCARCAVAYAELPEDADGYVFHDSEDYRPPARYRLVAGTPPDLSEKRRAAGRKGGAASAERRKTGEVKQQQAKGATPASAGFAAANAKQTSQQNPTPPAANAQQNPEHANPAPGLAGETDGFAGASKSSNLLHAGVSPVPVPVTLTSASNEAEQLPQLTLDGMPEPPLPERKEPTPEQRAFGLARRWMDARAAANTPVVAKGRNGALHLLKSLIHPFVEGGYTDDEIHRALRDLGEGAPSKAQLDRALTAIRTGRDSRYRQERRNGNLDGRRGMVRNTHARRDEYLAEF